MTSQEEESEDQQIYQEFSEKGKKILSILPEKINNNQKNNENSISYSHKKMCDFTLTNKLGEGTFGTVLLGINNQTSEKVAIKIMERNKIIQKEDIERVDREIKILQCIFHPNIVRLFNVTKTKEKIFMVMEYIKGKELFDYIILKKRLNEIEACKFFQQIISAIEYLSKLKTVHRDLKPENILIEEHSNTLKLVDFGLSNIYTSKNVYLKTACGSPSYAAPEMLMGMPYQAPFVDIWSSGIILYAMLCGYLPFEGENNEKLYENIMKGEFEIPNYISDKAKDLIKKILITDPKKRANISQIKNHPWFHLYKNEYGKIIIYEGLLLTEIVIPIDEEIIKEMIEKYNFGLKKEEIRIAILSNKHNDITTIYYLLLNNRIKKGKKSICDLKSNEFKKYIQNKENLFEKYEFDIKKLIEERKKGLFINNFYSNIGTNKNSTSHLKTPKYKNRNINTNSNTSNNNIKELKNYKTNFQLTSPNSNIMKKNNSKNLFHSGSRPTVSRKVVNKNLIFSPITKKTELHSYFSDKNLPIAKNKKNIYNKTETNTDPKLKQSKMLLSNRFRVNLNNNDFKNINLNNNNNKNNFNSINYHNNYHPFMTDHKVIKKIFDINNFSFDKNALIDLACLNYNNKNDLFEKIINLCNKFKYNFRKISDNKIKIEYFIQNFSMEIKIIKDVISNYNIIKFKILKGNNEMFDNISKKIINNIDIEKKNNE